MYPSIFKWRSGISWIGTIEITSYFLAVAVGMVLGTVLLWRWAKKRGLDGDDVLDLALWVAVFGLIGAKLMHVIADGYLSEYVHICTDPSQVFWDKWRVGPGYCRELGGQAMLDASGAYTGCVPTERNCLAWINLFAGGYTYYGGLIGGGLATFLFVRRRKLPLWPTVDTLTWIVILGLGFGRLGCFLNGCCFGDTTDSWLGVVFPIGSPAWVEQGQQGLIPPDHAPHAVLPVQLFEAAAAFALAAFLALWVDRRKRYPGEVFVVGLALYAMVRIALEFFRADPRGGFLGLSTSQLVGIGVLAGAAVLHSKLRGRAGEPPDDEDASPSEAPDHAHADAHAHGDEDGSAGEPPGDDDAGPSETPDHAHADAHAHGDEKGQNTPS